MEIKFVETLEEYEQNKRGYKIQIQYLPYCYRAPVVHKSLPCTGKAHRGLKLHLKIPTRGKTVCSNFTWERVSTHVTVFVKVPIRRKPTALVVMHYDLPSTHGN